MTVAICARCLKDRLIYARGLCQSCCIAIKRQKNPKVRARHNEMQKKKRESDRESFNRYHREYYHKMKKHKVELKEGEEFCLKCGLSPENNMHNIEVNINVQSKKTK